MWFSKDIEPSLYVYLTYIDESGNPERSDAEDEFVLAAFTINESEWKRVDTAIIDLKRKYFPWRDPDSFELHATDIIDHRKAFKNMPLDLRLKIMEDILKVVSEMDCVVCAVLLRKNMLCTDIDVDSYATELLFERLCYFHYVENQKKRDSGKDEEYGLLIIDSVNPKYDNKVRLRLKGLSVSEKKNKGSRYLVEDPIFVDSKYRHLSQIVDCIAYCIRRRFRSKSNDVDEKTQNTL